eukprot:tig00000158_g10197.t1
MSINYGGGGQYGGEYSDWQCAFVLVYDRLLSNAEVEEVEAWARMRFPGITYPNYGFTYTTSVPPSASSVVAQVGKSYSFQISINYGYSAIYRSQWAWGFPPGTSSSNEYSDWQCAFILVYDRRLSDAEVEEVEAWARLRFPGVTYHGMQFTYTTSVPPSATSVIAQVGKPYSFPGPIRAETTYTNCQVQLTNAVGKTTSSVTFTTGAQPPPPSPFSLSSPVQNQRNVTLVGGNAQFVLEGLNPADGLQRATVTCDTSVGDPLAQPPYAASIAGWYDGTSWTGTYWGGTSAPSDMRNVTFSTMPTGPPSTARVTYVSTSNVPFSGGVANLTILGLNPWDQVSSISVTCPQVGETYTTSVPPFAGSAIAQVIMSPRTQIVYQH